ncbi:MAG: hypothetical protein JW809_09865 [Pirellulales bacterium]|nr:hypothetical protein [Pirellulales bacterium]
MRRVFMTLVPPLVAGLVMGMGATWARADEDGPPRPERVERPRDEAQRNPRDAVLRRWMEQQQEMQRAIAEQTRRLEAAIHQRLEEQQAAQRAIVERTQRLEAAIRERIEASQQAQQEATQQRIEEQRAVQRAIAKEIQRLQGEIRERLEAGQREAAEQLQAKLHEMVKDLGVAAPREPERPRRPKPPEPARQLHDAVNHMNEAAARLREAGMADAAERLQREADEVVRESVERAQAPPDAAIHRLIDEVRRLRQDVDHLAERVHRLEQQPRPR